ncbi:MAG TPA: ribbon-helix-helix protein, CopG family [Vicinamibacterales bacterium]|nr:ribbon-helix-helix protein, CopG family [Vicinamibacterales bacterium]
MAKVTYTLDDETVRAIRKMADRSRKPQSLVVREAVAYYAARDEQTSPEERKRFMEALDEIARQPPTRTAADTDRELRVLRAERRRGGRVRPVS